MNRKAPSARRSREPCSARQGSINNGLVLRPDPSSKSHQQDCTVRVLDLCIVRILDFRYAGYILAGADLVFAAPRDATTARTRSCKLSATGVLEHPSIANTKIASGLDAAAVCKRSFLAGQNFLSRYSTAIGTPSLGRKKVSSASWPIAPSSYKRMRSNGVSIDEPALN
jgi:hypothetical protein